MGLDLAQFRLIVVQTERKKAQLKKDGSNAEGSRGVRTEDPRALRDAADAEGEGSDSDSDDGKKEERPKKEKRKKRGRSTAQKRFHRKQTNVEDEAKKNAVRCRLSLRHPVTASLCLSVSLSLSWSSY